MRGANRDTVVAVILLVVCGVLFWQTFHIQDPGYISLKPYVWPRGVIVLMTVFCLIYLAQSVRAPAMPGEGGIGAWFARYRNALWCYGLFALFLLTLDWLGMLIGGALFVFGVMAALGRRTARDLARYAVIAVVTVGLMWSIFTFGLNVFLPAGEILPPI